jgi:hypothetical protein
VGWETSLKGGALVFAGLAEITSTTLPFAAVAVGMIGLNLYIIYRLLAGHSVPALSTFVLGAAVLVSQAVFWGGVAYYLEVPTVDGFVIFSLAIQFMMVPVGVWFVSLVFEEGEHPVRAKSALWPVVLALLLLFNELLMSWAFAALVPGSLPAGLSTLTSAGQALLVASSTAWYYWPMGVSMLVLVRWSGLALSDRRALYTLTLSAFVAPWAFEVPLVGACAMAAVMALALAILWHGLQSPNLPRPSIRLRAAVVIAFLVMSASWAVSYLLLPPSWGLPPFAVAMIAIMTAELVFLLRTMLRREGSVGGPGGPVSTPVRSAGSVASAADRPEVPTPTMEPNG